MPTTTPKRRYWIRRRDGHYYCGPKSAANPVEPNWLPTPALVYTWPEDELDDARRTADRLDLMGFECSIEPAGSTLAP